MWVWVHTLAWAQIALASDYTPMSVMRALHKSVRRVYSASPWNAENTMRAVYAVAHHVLNMWLSHGSCTGFFKTSEHAELQPDRYAPVWCADLYLLQIRSAAA